MARAGGNMGQIFESPDSFLGSATDWAQSEFYAKPFGSAFTQLHYLRACMDETLHGLDGLHAVRGSENKTKIYFQCSLCCYLI